MAEGKEEKIELEGEVVEAFRNGMYRIALENGQETLGYTAGKMRRHRIRILPGDKIKVELYRDGSKKTVTVTLGKDAR